MSKYTLETKLKAVKDVVELGMSSRAVAQSKSRMPQPLKSIKSMLFNFSILGII